MRFIFITSRVLALALLLAFATQALGQETFIKPADRAGTLPEDKAPTVVRAMNVFADVGQLNANNRSLRVTAFDSFEIELGRIEPIPGKKGFIWYGRIAKEPGSAVIIAVVDGIASGNIDLRAGKVYQLRHAGGGVYSFREIDRTKFPDEAAPRPRPAPPPAPAPPPPPPPPGSCADPSNEIDVMVVYTQAARIAAGGKNEMEVDIYLAVAEANDSYFNSAINQRLRLVHVEEVSYMESGNHDDDLDNLQVSAGLTPNVQTLRDTFAADVVTMITQYKVSPTMPMACGLGYIMAPVGPSFGDFAYSVVRRECAAGDFSLAHEIGHNMGAHHQTGNGADPWSHALDTKTPADPMVKPWRTVMAEKTFPIETERVRHFSNPNIYYPVGGAVGSVDATGAAGSAENYLTLNATAATVSQFRCNSPGVTNVWMKDTWNDTGLEPDPGTASEPMWKSPYIWVRTTQDTNLSHQHEHENPVFNVPNWAYVKLQNGGAAANGNLELYWAVSSTSLVWPTDWALISSVPVSAPASSSKIVEFPWSPTMRPGHYCLLARWSSAGDPMATAEGPDITTNVRANNNLIWRNLNDIELAQAERQEVMLRVSNPDEESKAISIAVRSPSGAGKLSFVAAGQVLVEFDDALLKAWRDGGSTGTGFKVEGGRLIVGEQGAMFDNVLLPHKVQGGMKLTFRRLPSTPKREYIVDVEQRRAANFAAAKKLPIVVGGVSYEVHTDRDGGRH